MNNLNEDLVKKSWTNYYPSNFCIGVYLVVFFVRSIWRKRFSSYAYYDAYYESGTKDKGTRLWVTFEDCPKNVEYRSFEEVKRSVAIMFVLKEVMFFCTVFNRIYLSDIMGIIWKLR